MKQVVKQRINLSRRTKLIVSRRQYVSKASQKSRRETGEFYVSTAFLPGKFNEISFSLARNKVAKPVGYKLNLILNLDFKNTLPVVLMLAGLSGLVYFTDQSKIAVAIDLPAPTYQVETVKPAENIPYSLNRSQPQNIIIPDINVDEPIINVGQNADKTIEVPPLFKGVVGWYDRGPTPGEIGPAVIVGHVDTYKGPSVFYNLNKLKPGAKIEIMRADNTKAVFEVTSLAQFRQDNFPTDKVYGNVDQAELRLITCGGTFNKSTGKYSKNTVVFAKLIK